MPTAARSSRASACSSTDSRSCRAAACRSAASSPGSPTRSSSARRSWQARSRPRARSSRTTRKLVADVAELEHKARRQDVLVDDDAIAAFYAERVPPGVHSRATFERWREQAERKDPRALFLTREALMRHTAAHVTEALFPETLAQGGAVLPLKYRFAPGHPLDGLTLTAPLALLNQLDAARLSWLVPGMIREKVPVLPEGAAEGAGATGWFRFRTPSPRSSKRRRTETKRFPTRCAAGLRRGWAKAPPADAWDAVVLPAYLDVNVQVVDAAGRELASGRDLAALRAAAWARRPSSRLRGPDRRSDKRGLQALGFRRPAGDADAHAERATDHRLPGARRRRRRRVDCAAATRAQRPRPRPGPASCGCIRIALKDALARFEKGAPGFAQAALQLKTAIPTDGAARRRDRGRVRPRLRRRRSAAAFGERRSRTR